MVMWDDTAFFRGLVPRSGPDAGDGAPTDSLQTLSNVDRLLRQRIGLGASPEEPTSDAQFLNSVGQKRKGSKASAMPASSLEPEIQYKLVDHLVQQQDALCDLFALCKQTNDRLAVMGEQLSFMQDNIAENIAAAFRRQQLEPLGESAPKAETSPLRLVESGPQVSTSMGRHVRPTTEEASFQDQAATGLPPPPTQSASFMLSTDSTASNSAMYRIFGLAVAPDVGGMPHLRSRWGSSDTIAEHHRPCENELDFIHGHCEDLPERTMKCPVFGRHHHLHHLVDVFSMLLVVFNTIFTGLQVNIVMEGIFNGSPKPHWLQVADNTFTFLFTGELVIRWFMMGTVFLTGHDQLWNILDIVFVATSLFEVFVSFVDFSFLRAIRIFRVLRAFRALRGMRFVRDLRLMLASMMASVASFLWGFGLFFFVMFLFAILFMQSLVVAHEIWGATLTPPIYEFYGTVGTSIITLFKAVSGGKDWDDLLQPLTEVSNAYILLYTIYIAGVVFGVMNVITAVFVENASSIYRVDKDLVIHDEMDRRSGNKEDIKGLFAWADKGGTGMLSGEELENFLKAPERRAMLNLLGIDVSEARGLFLLMDVHKTNQVDLNAFVDAIIRVKGAATGCDAALLLHENKRMLIRLASFMCYTCDSFKMLFKGMDLAGKHVPLERYLNQELLEEQERLSKAGFAARIAHGL